MTYAFVDQQRLVDEPTKRAQRTAFERDRARVLHSAALRRLAAKTQVVTAGEADFPRTRLTHTLEVAQIARELGSALGCDPDLTDLAGLAHDLGHPPFGHNGESALDEVARPAGGFEGNAQSLRILTRLECKITDSDGLSVGLNLTRASLDAVIKYPWQRDELSNKFNVYSDDLPVFDWIREYAPERRQSFESQVMDWADDVAYSVHDVEDGVHAGHIDLGSVGAALSQLAICDLARQWYAPEADPADLEAALERILALPYWPTKFDGSPRDMAALKNLTSNLIGRFVVEALTATRQHFGDAPLTRYVADLVVPDEQRNEVAVLKAMANALVFQRPNAEVLRNRQREILQELVEAYCREGQRALDPLFVPAWAVAEDDNQRLRVVIDQVASLTDKSAIEAHRRMC